MKSRDYWIKRVANYTYTTYNSLEEKNIALMDMYDKAAKDISDELYAITEKIAQNGKVTRSDMHKFNRLTGLNKNINSILEQLTEDVKDNSIKSIIKAMGDVYKNVNVSLGNTKFDIPNKRVMEEMLNKPWQGSYFNKRLWGNTNTLAKELNSILTIGITQGKTIAEMSIQLKNATRKSFNNCHRLIRTETMSALNEASTRAYKDNGIEEVEVYCAVDERLCDTCGKYHKKKYPIDKCPHVPFHANCRCTLIPIIDIKKQIEINKIYNKKGPLPKRHVLNSLGKKSTAKVKNTIIMPWVDYNKDIESIKKGEYNKVKDGYEINGRVYGIHDERFYPISGDGFETLTRHEYQILIVLKIQSNSPRLLEILNNINATKEEIEKVKKILSELR